MKPASCTNQGMLLPVANAGHVPPQIAEASIPAPVVARLGPYPVPLHRIFAAILRGEYGPADSAGLPLVDYDRLFARNHIPSPGKIGPQYTPVTLAFFGLGHFARWQQEGAGDSERCFRRAAEWLVAHQVNARGTGGVWLHHFPMPHLPPLIEYMPGAWISAMAQGLGASLLLRAFAASAREEYLRAAHASLLPCKFAIAEGGVAWELPGGRLFLEEFPAAPPLHVLNGALFALIGLAEFLHCGSEAELKTVYSRALSGLLALLPEFDRGYGSLYDLRRRQIANNEYHDLHVNLLLALGELTQLPELLATGRRWRAYSPSRCKRVQRWLAERSWALQRRLRLGEAK
ncbi:MAG: D-glucuronyl C5-epimerase family protein [candidate division KSB1 bacterium]|nr:D-glucuronyl C5-epimerase family protein [candidate division KSB1 bacterium]MDZ7275510.1 D-glucuronyl C5-epimerase family protein [candidate division KSB1 bacterium]MDZ7286178.1 D-glucuronyl C5-epimerase family protein [candidate division KSB1 bacterium]MDZ7296404.1 D-glucuronyl C5-epimerase family protein [candidate division KSB1 bacterium]MDZ7306239.1 D-glucuronyl C5-epimerase family protein [candidate division KSB1 bacterium]